MEGQQHSIANRQGRCRKARSSLVRRLVQARDDPAKQRIRRWLSDINDERLLSFGLTPEDIVLLRGSGKCVNSLWMCALSLLSVPSPPGSWFSRIAVRGDATPGNAAAVRKPVGLHGLENNLSRLAVAALCLFSRNTEKRKFNRVPRPIPRSSLLPLS